MDLDTEHNIKAARENCRRIKRIVSKLEYNLIHGAPVDVAGAVLDTYAICKILDAYAQSDIAKGKVIHKEMSKQQ